MYYCIPADIYTFLRSFSSPKTIEVSLRSTVGENRFNGYFDMHPEILIKSKEVVNIYANKYPRTTLL